MVKVPGGTNEYQESIRKTKEYLNRLKKGSSMLHAAMSKNDIIQAQKILRHWEKLANEMFVELETATLIHQHLLTGNNVLLKPDGTLVKIEELADMNNIEMDPWLLLSLEKLKFIFGEEIKEHLTIK